MNSVIHSDRRIWQKRGLALAFAALCVPFSIATAGLAGYRLNLTPSEPIGLWRIQPLNRPARGGDVIFICPPERPDMEWAARRGYLRSGLCAGGYAPLIKMVAAVAGQHVAIGRTILIDRVPLPNSRLSSIDGKGRSLTPYAGGVIREGFVFLHSDFEGSYDSRYFGPLPVAGILGLAKEVLTFAP